MICVEMMWLVAVVLLCKVVTITSSAASHDRDERFDWLESEVLRLSSELNTWKQKYEAKELNVVAFTAYPNEGYGDYDNGVKILFPNTITNLGGGYDTGSSVFTCPVAGTYSFSLYADCLHDHRHLAGIYKNGGLVATANGNSVTQREASIGVVIECAQGDQVEVRSVEVESRIYNYNNYRTSIFMGYLLSI